VKSYKLASTTWNRQEVLTASKLLEAGNLTMGKKVREFEISFSEFIGSKYAVMFNSGSSANLGIFAALKYSNGLHSKFCRYQSKHIKFRC
jgi:CDP-6-deoxy-D-xylo-4-hexulose-3-dehydrase